MTAIWGGKGHEEEVKVERLGEGTWCVKEDRVLPVRVSHTRTMSPWALASRWQEEARGCHLRAVDGAEPSFSVNACDART